MRSSARSALIWVALFGVTILGYGVLAPIIDDYRSGLRAMVSGCKVIRVVDGDTVELGCPDTVWPGGRADTARIVGYDSPELFQPRCPAEEEAAKNARAALAQMLREGDALVGGDGALEVAFLGTDKYSRWLVDMRVGGERVATRMVAEGHGRRYLSGRRGGWC